MSDIKLAKAAILELGPITDTAFARKMLATTLGIKESTLSAVIDTMCIRENGKAWIA